ncbi:hypothetical protein V1519DRAFT_428260 [Lipomyces tetrasporus]
MSHTAPPFCAELPVATSTLGGTGIQQATRGHPSQYDYLAVTLGEGLNHCGASGGDVVRVFQGVSLFDYSVPEGRSRFEPRHNPVTAWSVSFLVVVIVEAGRVLAFEGYLIGKFEANINNANIDTAQRRDSNTVAIPTYLALFIFGEVYRLVLSWDALQLKNTIQYEQIKQAASLLLAISVAPKANHES